MLRYAQCGAGGVRSSDLPAPETLGSAKTCEQSLQTRWPAREGRCQTGVRARREQASRALVSGGRRRGVQTLLACHPSAAKNPAWWLVSTRQPPPTPLRAPRTHRPPHSCPRESEGTLGPTHQVLRHQDRIQRVRNLRHAKLVGRLLGVPLRAVASREASGPSATAGRRLQGLQRRAEGGSPGTTGRCREHTTACVAAAVRAASLLSVTHTPGWRRRGSACARQRTRIPRRCGPWRWSAGGSPRAGRATYRQLGSGQHRQTPREGVFGSATHPWRLQDVSPKQLQAAAMHLLRPRHPLVIVRRRQPEHCTGLSEGTGRGHSGEAHAAGYAGWHAKSQCTGGGGSRDKAAGAPGLPLAPLTQSDSRAAGVAGSCRHREGSSRSGWQRASSSGSGRQRAGSNGSG